MRTVLALAARYLAGRKLRTALTTLAIVFGVMLIFGLNAYIPTFIQAFEQNMRAAAGQVDLAVTSETNATFSMDVAEKLSRVSGIEHVTGVLERTVTLPEDAPASTVSVTGVDPSTVRAVRHFQITEGRFLSPSDGSAILIPEGLSRKAGLGLGDELELPSAGGLTPYRIVGIVQVRAVGAEQVFIPLRAAQAMFGESGRVNVAEASFSAEADREEVKRVVERRLGDRYKIGGLSSGSELLTSVQTGRVMMNMFGVMALAMASFIIYNTFRTIVTERRRDIGMLRAIGASRRAIIGIVGAESLLQGAIGTGLGLLAGYGIALALLLAVSPIAEQYLNVTVGSPVFTPGNFAVSIMLGMGVTLLGGLLPAIQASRVSPLEALRPQMAEVERGAYRKRIAIGVSLILGSVAALVSRQTGLAATGALVFLVGLIIIAPALVRPIAQMFGGMITLVFAREGDLASANMARQPGRAAVTASAMMISLAIVVSLVGMTTSMTDGFTNYLDKSLGADFLITPRSLVLSGGNIGAGPQLARNVRSTPGISTVTTLRIASSQAKGNPMQVIGIDPETYPKVAGLQFDEGNSDEAYAAMRAGGSIIVNGVYASQNAVRVGDMLTMKTPEGDKRYRIVAVGIDYLNAKLATVYMGQKDMANDFHVTNDVLIMANVAPGTSVPTVQKKLDRVLERYPTFTLWEAGEWRATSKQTLDQSMSMFYVLIVIMAVPSILALVNTLAMNVLERTRELGMLRAVGSTQKQVRRMILAESLLLSATGTAFGLLAGVWLGWALIGAFSLAGFAMPYYFPYQGLLLALAIGLLCGVAASVWPARQASKLDIVTALHYE